MQLIKTYIINSLTPPVYEVFKPSKPTFVRPGFPGQPYGPGDFSKMAIDAIAKFHTKSAWLPYYESCLALQKTDRLGAIHRAMSTAVIFALNQSIENVREFYSNPCEVIFEHVLPIVSDGITFCPEFYLSTLDRFVTCINQQSAIHAPTIVSVSNPSRL